jgi:transcriptional regulator with XRE-family HTH domain
MRKERRFTQEELALAAYIHPTHLSKIERSLCEPGARTISKLMTALGVSGGPLFDGIDGRWAATSETRGTIGVDAGGERQ